MIRLEVKDLNKTFKVHTRGSIEVKGFEDINLNVKQGEFLSLYGPSGAGNRAQWRRYVLQLYLLRRCLLP